MDVVDMRKTEFASVKSYKAILYSLSYQHLKINFGIICYKKDEKAKDL